MERITIHNEDKTLQGSCALDLLVEQLKADDYVDKVCTEKASVQGQKCELNLALQIIVNIACSVAASLIYDKIKRICQTIPRNTDGSQIEVILEKEKNTIRIKQAKDKTTVVVRKDK